MDIPNSSICGRGKEGLKRGRGARREMQKDRRERALGGGKEVGKGRSDYASKNGLTRRRKGNTSAGGPSAKKKQTALRVKKVTGQTKRKYGPIVRPGNEQSQGVDSGRGKCSLRKAPAQKVDERRCNKRREGERQKSA